MTNAPEKRPRTSRLDQAGMQALLSAALIVMTGVLASRVLGVVRNMVIGSQYGASREYETFLAAIRVPDTVFQVLAGGTVGAAFIPVFAMYLSRDERDNAWRVTSALINFSLVGIGSVALVLTIMTPMLMSVLVAGWTPEDQQHAATLARIMMASPVIFAISALLTSTLNGMKRFALASAAPLAYNLALILGATVGRPWGVEGLAVAAVLGALAHLLVQIPGVIQVGMRYFPTFALDLKGTREVGRLMIPRVIGLGVSQFNLLVNVTLASFLIEGSIAYLDYAWLILMAPLGVFAMGLSTAIFPTLAEQSAESRTEEQQQTFLFGFRLILYMTIPAAVGLIVLGRQIVGILYERGAFDPNAAAATAFALALFAIGLPGHAVIEIVDRVFYAERDTRTPVTVAACAVALNIALSLFLMRTGLSFGGLALANALAALTEATILSALLHRRTGWMRQREMFSFGWRIGVSALSMGIVAVLLQAIISRFFTPESSLGHAIVVIVVAGCSAAAYFGSSISLGIEDARRALQLFRRA